MEAIIGRARSMSRLWFPNAPRTSRMTPCKPFVTSFASYSGTDHQKPKPKCNDSFKVDLTSKPFRGAHLHNCMCYSFSPLLSHSSLSTMKMPQERIPHHGPQCLRNQSWGRENDTNKKTLVAAFPSSCRFLPVWPSIYVWVLVLSNFCLVSIFSSMDNLLHLG